MAAWPIGFSKGTRPGKRPHLQDVQANENKRRLYEKQNQNTENISDEEEDDETTVFTGV